MPPLLCEGSAVPLCKVKSFGNCTTTLRQSQRAGTQRLTNPPLQTEAHKLGLRSPFGSPSLAEFSFSTENYNNNVCDFLPRQK